MQWNTTQLEQKAKLQYSGWFTNVLLTLIQTQARWWMHINFDAMLLVSSHVPVITWLCSRAMRFQSRPTNWTLSPWNLRELSGYSIRLHHGGFKSPLGLRFFSDFLLHKRRITIPWFIDGERHYTQAPGWVWSRLTNLWSSLFIHSRAGFFAAASFMSFQHCIFNFGADPFK